MKRIVSIIVLTVSIHFSSIGQCDQNVRELVGALSFSHIYNTYIAIGSLADGYISEIYTEEQIEQLMTEQIDILKTLVIFYDNCKAKTKNGILADEEEYLQNLKLITQLLIEEAIALQNEAVNPSEENKEIFANARLKAWNEIEALMHE